MQKWETRYPGPAAGQWPVYRHRKTGGLYMWQGTVRNADDDTDLVLYLACNGALYARSRLSFYEEFEPAYAEVPDTGWPAPVVHGAAS